MIFPVCLSIASLVSSYGTDHFQAYLHAMKTFEEMVRCGTSLKFASEQDTIGHEEQDMEQVSQEENTVPCSDFIDYFPSPCVKQLKIDVRDYFYGARIEVVLVFLCLFRITMKYHIEL